MPAAFSTFERLKDKGVAAYKCGDFGAAKSYLIQAAECMLELADAAKSEAARKQHEDIAREMMELARSCDGRKTAARRDRAPTREGEDNSADPSDWVVEDKPNIRFDDIAGLEDVKQEIRLKMIYPFQRPDLAQRYGISIGGGVLLYGPPGTGKTMMAKAIACEIDATMFVITPAQIMSKWVGEAEQNIRKLFDAAKSRERSIIFIDEIEALVPRRRESGDSPVMTRLVPQILQELEGFDRKADRPLLFVGATNEPWSLDPAVLRPGRFDAKVYVPLPDAPARHRLLELHLGQRPMMNDVDFTRLVTLLEGYSGADIKAIAARAASFPFIESIDGGESREISMADLLRAIQESPPSVNPRDLERFSRYAEQN